MKIKLQEIKVIFIIKKNNFYSEEISSILIEDLKSFERLKSRNDKELLDLIENEVNKNIFKLIMKRK